VLKCGAFLFAGWLGLWLAAGIVGWLASGTSEGIVFVILAAEYGACGGIMFGMLGAWYVHQRSFSWVRCILSAAVAGVVAFAPASLSLRDWPNWIYPVGPGVGVVFGLLLRWLLFSRLRPASEIPKA